MAEASRSLDSLPKDLLVAIEAGKVPGSIVCRYIELENSSIFQWLLRFGGFKERLLADDLFLVKVALSVVLGSSLRFVIFFSASILLLLDMFSW